MGTVFYCMAIMGISLWAWILIFILGECISIVMEKAIKTIKKLINKVVTKYRRNKSAQEIK
ncbi:MAG: hypothetical protein VB095_07580 [Anaerovorax sp.]|nr:hypothetical protein [Anaerovorax sp.]